MDANTHSPLRALETSWSGNGVYLFNVSSTDQILTNMDHHNHKRASLYPTIDLTLKRIGEKAIERHRIFTGSNRENAYKQLRKKLVGAVQLTCFCQIGAYASWEQAIVARRTTGAREGNIWLWRLKNWCSISSYDNLHR